ncbi:MAG: DUF5683 domain-containing protein [candidate division KSB1 bacterium]|nr:DUF5683 domain-containing protein [candidate division KSB1 bacterium]MDZ7319931.1 DUF5683 domain-containing protein [candidate division KSB1 bacterium]MDZ7342475.1 DUF5683 domain-containing protein [candidate division KSB1 bacterium]
MIKKEIICFVVCCCLVVGASAQNPQAKYQQLMQAFQQLDYKLAEKIGREIVANYTAYTPIELLETHKILGVIAFIDGYLPEARVQFEQALSIDRSTQLDSVIVSPKIIQFFNDLKSKYVYVPKPTAGESLENYRYLLVPDPRPGATWRSLLLPGWGQFYKRDLPKGYIVATAAAAAALTTGVFHWLQRDAHAQYLDATEPNQIEVRYKRYNDFYRIRNNAALITGGVWLYAFLDALLCEPNKSFRPVSVQWHEQNWHLAFHFSF